MRDNMAVAKTTRCSAATAFAIVDEVDSIYRRGPHALIISGRADDAQELYVQFAGS